MSDLHRACETGNIEEVRLLVDSGADIEVKNNDGWTPLYVVSRNGHIDIVKLLVDLGPSCMAAPAVMPGADIEAKATIGWTPLLYASRYGCVDIVKLLINLGADIGGPLYIMLPIVDI